MYTVLLNYVYSYQTLIVMETNSYKAKVIIYNNNGEVILEREIEVDIHDGDINEIEQSVYDFRKDVLPEITGAILDAEQRAYVKKSPKQFH